MASPAPGGITPSRDSTRARAPSKSSRCRSQAWSEVAASIAGVEKLGPKSRSDDKDGHLRHCELGFVQLRVKAAAPDQLLVTSPLHDPAAVQDHYLVRGPHRGKTVRDHEGGAALKRGRQRHLDFLLGLRV